MAKDILPAECAAWAEGIKDRIRHAQTRAALAVTRELVVLYWEIGNEILDREKRHGWGAKVVERLAHDLHTAFPDQRGFSPRNLRYMRDFARTWPEPLILQQVAAKLPWGHNQVLLDRVSDHTTRLWYAQAAAHFGWSRAVLVHQIETKLHQRQGRAITTFAQTLPAPESDLAQQVLKDPYNFDFLTLMPEARERDLERGLLNHLKDFLLELGKGFSFVGSQYHLQVGNQDFYIDLLFFHTELLRYVVVELKVGAFAPEHVGQMSLYIAAVDNLLKRPGHNSTIGLILCKEKNHVVVQYALAGMATPMGVAEYVLNTLPDPLTAMLPTVEEFEEGLADPPAADPPEQAATAVKDEAEAIPEDETRDDTINRPLERRP